MLVDFINTFQNDLVGVLRIDFETPDQLTFEVEILGEHQVITHIKLEFLLDYRCVRVILRQIVK